MVLFSDLFSLGALTNIATILVLAYPSLKWVKKSIEARNKEINETLSELKAGQESCNKAVTSIAAKAEALESKVDTVANENRDRLETLKGKTDETISKVSNVEQITTTTRDQNGQTISQALKEMGPLFESASKHDSIANEILKQIRKLDRRMSALEKAGSVRQKRIEDLEQRDRRRRGGNAL